MTSEGMRRHWADPEVRTRRALGVLVRRSERRVAAMRKNGTPESLILAEQEKLEDRLRWKTERSQS